MRFLATIGILLVLGTVGCVSSLDTHPFFHFLEEAIEPPRVPIFSDDNRVLIIYYVDMACEDEKQVETPITKESTSFRWISHNASSLQCPLCTNTRALQLRETIKKENEERLFWNFRCNHCNSLIQPDANLSEYYVRNMLAYKVPEKGREWEDYQR